MKFAFRRKYRCPPRSGYTLLELILSLALAAVIAAMIGNLIQIYLIDQEKGQDSVQQAQLARAILSMISEDIRTTVRYQPFDVSGLQQLLSSDSGGGAGGAGGGSGGAAGGLDASGSDGSGGASGGGSGGASSASGSSSGSTSSSSTSTAPLPPGLYGTSTSLEVDISRLPRPDEYYPTMANPTTGSLGDMPSDIKTVGYYVQPPGSNGAQDPLGALRSQSTNTTVDPNAVANGGLVRRSVDRAITQYAYQMGNTTQLQRTGQLIAPEVLAIEFQYFDGATWQLQWDGSTQGLPHVVKITIAMQRASKARTNPITPGISIASITSGATAEHGIEIYSTNTIIPGAQLLVAPQGTTATGSSSSGMSSMGLK